MVFLPPLWLPWRSREARKLKFAHRNAQSARVSDDRGQTRSGPSGCRQVAFSERDSFSHFVCSHSISQGEGATLVVVQPPAPCECRNGSLASLTSQHLDVVPMAAAAEPRGPVLCLDGQRLQQFSAGDNRQPSISVPHCRLDSTGATLAPAASDIAMWLLEEEKCQRSVFAKNMPLEDHPSGEMIAVNLSMTENSAGGGFACPEFVTPSKPPRCLVPSDSPPPASPPRPDAMHALQGLKMAGRTMNRRAFSLDGNAVSRRRITDHILEQHYLDVADVFQLECELGRGMSGIVSRCTDRKTGKAFACKRIYKKDLRCQLDVRGLVTEVGVLRSIAGHPAVVSLEGVFEDSESINMVMELCEGGDLFDRIQKRKMYSERNAAIVCQKLASVLMECHAQGIMHRDLKPENILLASTSSDVDIRVADFGSAARFKPGERLTQLVGSAMYMAPCVLRHNYGPEADLWSLGVILHILLSGVPPFWAATNKEIFRRIREGVYDLKKGPWKRISDGAKDLVRQLLHAESEQRICASNVAAHPWIVKHCGRATIPCTYAQAQANIPPTLKISTPTLYEAYESSRPVPEFHDEAILDDDLYPAVKENPLVDTSVVARVISQVGLKATFVDSSPPSLCTMAPSFTGSLSIRSDSSLSWFEGGRTESLDSAPESRTSTETGCNAVICLQSPICGTSATAHSDSSRRERLHDSMSVSPSLANNRNPAMESRGYSLSPRLESEADERRRHSLCFDVGRSTLPTLTDGNSSKSYRSVLTRSPTPYSPAMDYDSEDEEEGSPVRVSFTDLVLPLPLHYIPNDARTSQRPISPLEAAPSEGAGADSFIRRRDQVNGQGRDYAKHFPEQNDLQFGRQESFKLHGQQFLNLESTPEVSMNCNAGNCPPLSIMQEEISTNNNRLLFEVAKDQFYGSQMGNSSATVVN